MDSRTDPDVIVVGGGIGGLTAGIALLRAGLRTRVFERAPELAEVGAGITLWSNAIRVLRALGAASEVERRSGVLADAELRRADGRVMSRFPFTEIAARAGAPCIALHRADLVEALRSVLPADALRLGAELVELDDPDPEDDRAHVVARFTNGETVQARILVGADGIHSRVRERLHGASEPRYAGYTCWRGVAPHSPESVAHRSAIEIWGRGRRFGIVRLGPERAYWFACANTPRGEVDTDARAHLHALLRDFAQPVHAIIDATPERAILRNDIVDRDPIREWGRGRATLLGDAAHASTPNLGQGACMAIEDAFVLARLLGAHGLSSATLRAYERARGKRTGRVTLGSRRLGAIGQLENPVLVALRELAVRATPARLARRTFAEFALSGPA